MNASIPEFTELALYFIPAVSEPFHPRHVYSNPNLTLPTFNPNNYSLMKYGFQPPTIHYAKKLYELFRFYYPQYFEANSSSNVLITSSAFKNMPVAATTLAKLVFGFINEARMKLELDPIEYTKIYRHVLLSNDYSQMSPAERETAMRANRIDLNPSRVQHQHIVVIDDCSITGGHRKKIQAAAAGMEIKHITYLYVLQNLDPESGKSKLADGLLDHAYVDSLRKWAEIMRQSDMGQLTARQMKYFLASKASTDELEETLRLLPCSIVSQLYYGCINDGFVKQYSRNFQLVKRAWETTCQSNNFSTTPPPLTHLL